MASDRSRVAAVAALALAAGYWLLVRPWHRRWGLRGDDATRPLPGDEIIPEPGDQVTHAVGVDAPPEDVWPWLAQLGQGRGGFYSYDWLENLLGADIHNADRVLPQYQDVAVGDVVRLAPPDHPAQSPDSALDVVVADEDRALVLSSPLEPPNFTWASSSTHNPTAPPDSSPVSTRGAARACSRDSPTSRSGNPRTSSWSGGCSSG